MTKEEAIGEIKKRLAKHEIGKFQFIELPAGLVRAVIPEAETKGPDKDFRVAVGGLRDDEKVYQPVDLWAAIIAA